MTPMTFDEWRRTDGGAPDAASAAARYRTYVDAVIFIRSQVGGMPLRDGAAHSGVSTGSAQAVG